MITNSLSALSSLRDPPSVGADFLFCNRKKLSRRLVPRACAHVCQILDIDWKCPATHAFAGLRRDPFNAPSRPGFVTAIDHQFPAIEITRDSPR
jgi:hypothetical protein